MPRTTAGQTKRAKTTAAATSAATVVGNLSDDGYRAILGDFQASALARIGTGPVFTTDAADLFALYVESFPATDRQHHTCSACRSFMETYGGLVTIGEAGETEPVFWPDAPTWAGDYARPVAHLRSRVRSAKVTGVFLAKEAVWGKPVTGPWMHFAVTLAKPLPRRSAVLTPGQEMAERREDYATVTRAIGEWSIEVLNAAVGLLDSDALYRSEKLKGAAVWLRDLAMAKRDHKGRIANNLVWRAIGAAPAGFCHPRSGMIGTLLDDLASGAPFSDVSERFAAKMHPLRYQRPQAAPTAGAIQQAEKIVEQLGLARSFARRFARFDEVPTFWTATPVEPKPSGGVFGHLTPKGADPAVAVTVPERAMSWAVFARDVLPHVKTLHVYTPQIGGYVTLTTAEHADAPPIMQWDREDARNPVCWYVWHGGSPASQYGLKAGAWTSVLGLSTSPHEWNGTPSAHFGAGVLVYLDGAKETRNQGSALFPECIKSDLHSVRSVIEAHARSQNLINHGDHAGATALLISAKHPSDVRLRATRDGVTSVYRIDRWE
jgi:hypothetical protein